jgi:transcriptional regulator with XRE-family HTH domain
MKNFKSMIGKRIKEVRKNLGLKQDQLAKHLGCSKSNISQIENGLFYPTAQSLILLKSKFNVSLDWLFSGERPMYNDEKNKDLDLLDFKEYSNDIKTMLMEMKNSKSIMHLVLAEFFEIKLEKNPSISERQKIKNDAMQQL